MNAIGRKAGRAFAGKMPMAGKRRYMVQKKRKILGRTRLAVVAVAILLIIVPIIKPLMYKLGSTSIASCLIPYTRLSLVLSELNDTLGAKNLVLLYTPCGSTSCSTASKSLSIPLSSLRKKPVKELSIGEGVLDNILIELATGETIPPSRIMSTGVHGSSLLFTWNYPYLKAILYVGLESRKAIVDVKGIILSKYRPPRGCSLLSSSTQLTSSNESSDAYMLICKDNIFAKKLSFTKTTWLLKVEQVTLRDYYCPGTGSRLEYINVSPLLLSIGSLLASLIVWTELRKK